jgi:hypothetical protein
MPPGGGLVRDSGSRTDAIAAIGRSLLAVVFLYCGLTGGAEVVLGVRDPPSLGSLDPPLQGAVSAWEATLGAWLMLASGRRAPALAALATLSIYTGVLVGWGLQRGFSSSCPCSPGGGPLLPSAIARNLLLLCVAGAISRKAGVARPAAEERVPVPGGSPSG